MEAGELRRTVAALPAFLAAPLHRSRHLRWGATAAELSAAMPGDELVPKPHFQATRAITIDAPPADVWPWIMQVGYARAGFYSYDLLDSLGHPSARKVLEEWQHLGVGDLAAPMTSRPDAETSFRIAQLEPQSALVWAKPDSSWSWLLTPLDGRRTRLVTRLKQRYRWRAQSLLTIPLLELGDYPMMRRMLRGLKERSEALHQSKSH